MLPLLKRMFRKSQSIKLNVLIYEEDGEWIAHCLQMDIVAANNNIDSVQDDIVDLIKAHVIFAFENDNIGNIFRSAPPEEWTKYLQSKNPHCDVRKITIPLTASDSNIQPNPLSEVEFCFT